MPAEEIYNIFNTIREKIQNNYQKIRDKEKDMPGLRKPRNFSYMLVGNFTKQEDPYFRLEDILIQRGRSFTALGIDYQ